MSATCPCAFRHEKKEFCGIMRTDTEHVKRLPDRAKLLWAKTPRRFGRGSGDCDADLWLPLYMHMADSAETAARLWEAWIPPGVKDLIAAALSGDAAARRLFLFLAAAHDLGKATPAFQQKSTSLAAYTGLSIPIMDFPNRISHSLAGHCILLRHGFDESVAVIVGGHHGKPPRDSEPDDALAFGNHTGFDAEEWIAVQDALLAYACALSGASAEELKQMVLTQHPQAILPGLVILTDWIASDENRFAYIPLLQFHRDPSSKRAASAWADLRLPPYWEALTPLCDAGDFFRARFGIEPRPVQTAVFRAVSEAKNPGIVIIEAPMGEGKTEAALAAAELLAGKSGRGGVFVGLPTMATSDGMFGRVRKWVNALGAGADAHYAMFLAHGKAQLNDEYSGLKAEPNVGDAGEESAVVNDWFRGRKKGVLANFVVGTVDQLLLAALKMRHVALRHLAFAYKVVVIDECHAYDAYMNVYLHRALEWLGKYRTPVIVLSATLPCAERQKLIEAYLGKSAAPPAVETPVWKKAAAPPAEKPEEAAQKPAWTVRTDYPIITYSDGDEIKQLTPSAPDRAKTLRFALLPDAALPDKLCDLLSDGGCAGVVCDTVGRAQDVMRLLAERFAETERVLVHARFLGIDRMKKEKMLRDLLGPPDRADALPRPARLIVVGTQVLEQSLDIDFDLLVSDIAPMDLLLQRVGRLHRHMRARPAKLREALCFVTGVQDAAEWKLARAIERVYSPYMLIRSLLLLPLSPACVSLPGDISPLVQAAYAEADADAGGTALCAASPAAMPQEKREAYDRARKAHRERIRQKEGRAKTFRLRSPASGNRSLLDWIDIARTDKDGRKLRDAANAMRA